MELSTAVKPFLLRQLFARGHGKVLYIDPDIWVFRPLDELFAWLDESDVLLTPHLTGPLGDGHYPDERDILLSGTYNLGFLGIADTEQVDALLRWWSERCEFLCVSDITHGMFVDQRWMDLAPGLVGQRAHRARSRLQPGVLEPQAPHALGTAGGAPRERRARALLPLERVRPHEAHGALQAPGPLPEDRDRAALGRWRASTARSCWRPATAPARPGPTRSASFKDGHPIAKEMRDLFRTHPPGRFPDPFEPAGDDSFVRWATTPPARGRARAAAGEGPRKLRAHRPQPALEAHPARTRAAEDRGEDAGAAARGAAPARAARPAREPGAGAPRRRAAGVRAARRRGRPPGVRALAVPRRDRPPQAEARLGGGLAGGGRGRRRHALAARLLRRRTPSCSGSSPRRSSRSTTPTAFLAWLEAHALARGFPAPALAAVRRLFASRPAERVRSIYASRPDVQGAYPDALAWPAAPGFLAWLHLSGRAGARPVRGQRALLRARGAPARLPARGRRLARAPGVAGTASARPDRVRPRRVPRLAARRARRAGPGGPRAAVRGETHCRPSSELRLFHREDAEARARGPRAFEDPDDTDALLDVRAGARGGARRLAPPGSSRRGARCRRWRCARARRSWATCARSPAWASCPARRRAR